MWQRGVFFSGAQQSWKVTPQRGQISNASIFSFSCSLTFLATNCNIIFCLGSEAMKEMLFKRLLDLLRGCTVLRNSSFLFGHCTYFTLNWALRAIGTLHILLGEIVISACFCQEPSPLNQLPQVDKGLMRHLMTPSLQKKEIAGPALSFLGAEITSCS